MCDKRRTNPAQLTPWRDRFRLLVLNLFFTIISNQNPLHTFTTNRGMLNVFWIPNQMDRSPLF